MRRTGVIWTPAMIERARRLALDGNSGSEIAAVFGMTRNAIIGVCHRNGISLRSRPAAGGHGGAGREAKPKAAARTAVTSTFGDRWSWKDVKAPAARAKPQPAAKPEAPAPAPVIKAAVSFVERAPVAAPDASFAVPLIETRAEVTQCRAPLWKDRVPADPAQALVCGAPVAEAGCAWCGFHAERFIAARAA